jgi:hypothetical protein
MKNLDLLLTAIILLFAYEEPDDGEGKKAPAEGITINSMIPIDEALPGEEYLVYLFLLS